MTDRHRHMRRPHLHLHPHTCTRTRTSTRTSTSTRTRRTHTLSLSLSLALSLSRSLALSLSLCLSRSLFLSFSFGLPDQFGVIARDLGIAVKYPYLERPKFWFSQRGTGTDIPIPIRVGHMEGATRRARGPRVQVRQVCLPVYMVRSFHFIVQCSL